MINERKQGDSCRTSITFSAGLFVAERNLKDQAKKILEEAAEVYSAFEDLDNLMDDSELEETCIRDILDECADTIQAAMNMIYALGMDKYGIEAAMGRCLSRNKVRGRC